MNIKGVRKLIFLRDDNKCYKCGNTEHLCLDHIIPKPQFQIHTVDNIVTLCFKCNFKKGIKLLPEDELLSVMNYINKRNIIFDSITKKEMNRIIYEYYTTLKSKKDKHKQRNPRQITLDRFEKHINPL